MTDLRCPTCRAPWRAVATCSRCGTDLLPLMRLAARAHALRESARQALLDPARADEALALAREAHRLQRTSRSTTLLTVALVAADDREGALAVMVSGQTQERAMSSVSRVPPGSTARP